MSAPSCTKISEQVFIHLGQFEPAFRLRIVGERRSSVNVSPSPVGRHEGGFVPSGCAANCAANASYLCGDRRVHELDDIGWRDLLPCQPPLPVRSP